MNDTTAATEELRRALAAEEGGRRWLRRLAVAGSIVLVLGGGLTWRAKHRPAPPAKYVTKSAEIGDVIEKVQATGAIQPLLQVNVGAQVNGRVTRVPVDFNSVVKKGDVLAEIDPKILGTQVYAQQSNLLQQRAALETAKAQMETSRAQMNLAKVTLDRTQRLFDDSLAAKGDLDTARGQWLAAKATYDAAVASVTGATAAIGSQVAQLDQMTTNLGYTKIISPVDGVVVTRSIDPGATVVSSFQAPVLFVIAQELKRMRVMADVDEADVGRLKEGMSADAVVDAFPGESFHGIVQQVRYSPNTVSGVVTYSAVVEVENPDEKLRPGMTATVTIKTSEAKGATKIPNAALRYKPTPPDGPDGKPIVPPPDPPLAKGQGRVYVLTSDKPGEEKEEMRVIPIGITDGIATEVLNGALPPGTKVVTDETDTKKKGGMF
ncbi:MAG: efflux RND transporter periplasmic adaptor subunit [Polyangiaceae bacterium]|jgi:HlyD family secretion protein